MNGLVQTTDLEAVTELVKQHGQDGAPISQVVESIAKTQNVAPKTARFVVRVALDNGKVKTDRNFKLHLTESK